LQSDFDDTGWEWDGWTTGWDRGTGTIGELFLCGNGTLQTRWGAGEDAVSCAGVWAYTEVDGGMGAGEQLAPSGNVSAQWKQPSGLFAQLTLTIDPVRTAAPARMPARSRSATSPTID
jgi:hypothetical protein